MFCVLGDQGHRSGRVVAPASATVCPSVSCLLRSVTVCLVSALSATLRLLQEYISSTRSCRGIGCQLGLGLGLELELELELGSVVWFGSVSQSEPVVKYV